MAGPRSCDERLSGNDILTVLASEGVEFFISGEEKVPLSCVQGKTICLFFSANWCRPCRSFTPQLVQLYNSLNQSEHKLEIIFVSFDKDENGFTEHFKSMPWLTIPFDPIQHKKLSTLFCVNRIPSFVARGTDGGYEDAIEFVEDYGVEAFPFTIKRKEELIAIDKAKSEGGKIEQLLAWEERNYLISADGTKVLISDLVGKTIGLYFGAHWCPPCRAFTEQLAETYNEILDTSPIQSFEVVLISTDRDRKEFDLNLSNMPWLAIPFEDKVRQDLCRIFNIQGIPALVIIGSDGKTITRNGRPLVSLYGAKAFPFTESRILEVEDMLRKEKEGFAEQVKDPKHEHVLKLDMAKAYVCNSCRQQGKFWAYSCSVCDYDLHPMCVEQPFNGTEK